MKQTLILTSGIGAVVGAYVPTLWGEKNDIGLTSVLFTFAGGLIGLWVGWKLVKYIED